MNQHPHLPPEPSPLIDTLGEHPAILWISKNGRYLLWFLLGLIAVSVLIFKFSGSSGSPINDYFKAENEFNAFSKEQNPQVQKEALNRLEILLKKYPDLQAKYDGKIAQLLLDRGDYNSALNFANRTITRTGQDQLPTYTEFSKITLLVGKESFESALKQSKELKNKLIAEGLDKTGTRNLYLYTLLRIAMLEEQVGNKEQEFEAWQELKLAIKNDRQSTNSSSTDNIIKQLDIGKTSLLNYIEMRERLLKR